jgi:two-component system NtrC family sensor kinase
MKYFLSSMMFLLSVFSPYAQTKAIDSLNRLIAKAASDTQRINLELAKCRIISNVNLDSGITLAAGILNQSKQINYIHGEAEARIKMAGGYNFTGNYGKSKETLDSTKVILSHTQDSITLAKMYNIYGSMYSMQNKFDSSHAFFSQSIAIARQINDKGMLSTALQNNAIAFQQESNYPQALTNYQEALSAAEQINDQEGEAFIDLNIAITFMSLDEIKRAEEAFLKSINFAQKLDLKNVLAYGYANLASLYDQLKDYPKEYDASMKAAGLGKEMGDRGIEATSLTRAAQALAGETKFEEAEKLTREGIAIADSSRQPLNIFQTYETMGFILHKQKKYGPAIPYFEKAFHSITQSDIYDEEVGKSYADLSDCYEKTNNFQKALSAYKIATKISDSIRGKENIKKSTELTLNYEFQKSQQKVQDEQQKKNDLAKVRQTALIIGLILTIIIAIVAFRGFRNKRKANHLLQEQKEKVESTLSELRSTQSQLIQSEKMASLGELTAGIAHEIQNPLNFVNNFSEVNTELIDEARQEIDKGNIAELKIILDNIKENEQKINQHGRRADAIVKGMLQHSRSSSGQKEPVNLNRIAEECLKLSYQALRAKDKTFQANLKMDFDDSVDKVPLVQQDIVRVLVNLYNNAFYAVNEKRKQHIAEYEPIVSVNTKRINDKVLLKVMDNANGISQKVIDKIFQPFFTTKPAGLGTGLGLSLSYDIIKAHGGEIKVESKEGVGSQFIIQLPALG